MINKNKTAIEDLATKTYVSTAIDSAVGKLAIMIQEGFAGMESRMAKQTDMLTLIERVDNLESRFGKLESRFDKLEARLDSFEKNANDRFDKIFSELKEIRKEIKNNNIRTRAEVAALDVRITKLEKKLIV